MSLVPIEYKVELFNFKIKLKKITITDGLARKVLDNCFKVLILLFKILV